MNDIIKLGGVEIKNNNDIERTRRLAMLLWGSSGTGKTTLAATAMGRKLWINFDPDGPDAIVGVPNVDVVDLSASSNTIMEQFKKADNPLGLKSVIENYDTIIVDSMTNVVYKALHSGISTVKGATVERPSPGAYQVRNALTMQLTKNLLKLTSVYNKNIIIICHEAAPMTNDEGAVQSITLMLGGQLPEQTSLDFSEVWNLSDTGKERRIAVRPVRFRKPMKSRMFSTKAKSEFVWKYDAENLTGEGISDWYQRWQESGYKKIAIPT